MPSQSACDGLNHTHIDFYISACRQTVYAGFYRPESQLYSSEAMDCVVGEHDTKLWLSLFLGLSDIE